MAGSRQGEFDGNLVPGRATELKQEEHSNEHTEGHCLRADSESKEAVR